MRKVLCLISVISLLLLAACGRAQMPDGVAESAGPAWEEELAFPGGLSKTGMVMADACYIEGADSFSELLEKADFIVQGTVTGIEQIISVSQKATVQVSRVYSGEVPDTIYVLQMADANPMKEGGEYLLFMKLQNSANRDDMFYPFGGGLGVVKVMEGSRQLMVANRIIDDEDLRSWVSEKTPYGSFSIGIGKEGSQY